MTKNPITPQIRFNVRQKIIVGFTGTSPTTPWVLNLQRKLSEGLGGVVLFKHNIPAEVAPPGHKALLTSLRTACSSAFLGVDQEGGKVQRINSSNGYFDSPSPQQLAVFSAQERQAALKKLVALIVDLGFNWNFAPSVDVDCDHQCSVIGAVGRSFSKDPQKVIECAREYIDEHRRQGVLSCIKHFPGHGSAQGDTHELGVDVTKHWKDHELVPFRELAKSGHADAIMTAHIVHTGIDDLPASLSKKWVDKLRNELGYGGVIVTDDLHMGGILNKFKLEEAARTALHAGADLLMFSNNPLAAKGVKDYKPDLEVSEKVAAVIEEEIAAGRYTLAQLDASIERIQKLRAKLKR